MAPWVSIPGTYGCPALYLSDFQTMPSVCFVCPFDCSFIQSFVRSRVRWRRLQKRLQPDMANMGYEKHVYFTRLPSPGERQAKQNVIPPLQALRSRRYIRHTSKKKKKKAQKKQKFPGKTRKFGSVLPYTSQNVCGKHAPSKTPKQKLQLGPESRLVAYWLLLLDVEFQMTPTTTNPAEKAARYVTEALRHHFFRPFLPKNIPIPLA